MNNEHKTRSVNADVADALNAQAARDARDVADGLGDDDLIAAPVGGKGVH